MNDGVLLDFNGCAVVFKLTQVFKMGSKGLCEE